MAELSRAAAEVVLVALVGPSGVGKSTLARQLQGWLGGAAGVAGDDFFPVKLAGSPPPRQTRAATWTSLF